MRRREFIAGISAAAWPLTAGRSKATAYDASWLRKGKKVL
jgi:hypothetical protein